MANRYWVGGSGTWDTTSTTHWSATSGGAAGASVPTSADTAIFDQATTYVVTFQAFLSLTAAAISNTAGTVTFSGGSAGSLTTSAITLTATAVWSATSHTLTLSGTGSFTLDTKGVSISSSLTINTVGSTWTLASNFVGSAVTSFTGGTLNLSSFTWTCPSYSSTSANTRTLACGTGKLIITGTTAGGVVSVTGSNHSITGSRRIDISKTSGTSTFSYVDGGAGNCPLLYVTTGAFNFTINAGTGLDGLDFTGYTGQLTFATGTTQRLHAGLTLNTGMTMAINSATVTFDATSGTQVITPNGVSFGSNMTFSGVGGTWQLAGALTLSIGTITLDAGTLNTNSQAVSVISFTSSSASTRVLAMGTSVFTFGSNWTVGGTAASFSMTGTGTITGSTSAGVKTFNGGGYQGYPTLKHGGQGTLNVNGNNKFANITNANVGSIPTLNFEAGSSNEFTAFGLLGAAGFQVTLGSQTSGTQALLRKSTSWTVGVNSTNGGNNTGLTFTGTNPDYLYITDIYGLGLPVTYSSTVTDTMNVIGTPSTNTPYFSDVANTANALDATSSAPAYLRLIDNTANALDALTTVATFGSTVANTTNALDAPSSLAALGATVANTTNALDTPAGNFAIPSALAETANALDTPSSSQTYPRDVAEAATALDAPSALATFKATATDTMNALDTPSALTIYIAVVANSAQGADTVSAALLLPANVSDTANGLDASSSVFIQLVTGSVTENATGADLVSVLPSTFTVLMIEGAAAQDAVLSGASFQGTFSDGVLVVDEPTAKYLWNLINDSQTANWQNDVTTQSPGWQEINNTQTPGWTPVRP